MPVTGVRRCLAFDPGTRMAGWALAEMIWPIGRPRFIAGGNVATNRDALTALIESWWPPGQPFLSEAFLVAVEEPGRYIHDRFRGAALMDTRGVGESILTIAHAKGIAHVSVPVRSWRRKLCGPVHGTAGDALVKRVLQALVEWMPARTNVHLRDALGLACVALRPAAIVSTLPKPWRPKRKRR